MFPTFLQQTDRLDRFFIITKVATYKIDNGFRLCVRFCYCGFPDTKQEQKKKINFDRMKILNKEQKYSLCHFCNQSNVHLNHPDMIQQSNY